MSVVRRGRGVCGQPGVGRRGEGAGAVAAGRLGAQRTRRGARGEPLGRDAARGAREQEEPSPHAPLSPPIPLALPAGAGRDASCRSVSAREPSSALPFPPCHGRCRCRDSPDWRASASVLAVATAVRRRRLFMRESCHPPRFSSFPPRSAGHPRVCSACGRAAAAAPFAGWARLLWEAHCLLGGGGACSARGTFFLHGGCSGTFAPSLKVSQKLQRGFGVAKLW